MPCPNCNRSFRDSGNGLAFHLTWCKPTQPVAVAEPRVRSRSRAALRSRARRSVDRKLRTERAERDAFIYGTNAVPDPLPVVGCVWPVPPEYARLVDRPSVAELTGRSLVLSSVPCFHCDERDMHAADCQWNTSGPSGPTEPEPPTVAEPTVRARKAPGPKLPAMGTGKHARCVAHEPMTRTGPGVAYACFDVAPDADALGDRRAFVAAIDDSWTAHHAAEALRPVPDGLVAGPDGRRMTAAAFRRVARRHNGLSPKAREYAPDLPVDYGNSAGPTRGSIAAHNRLYRMKVRAAERKADALIAA